MSDGRLTTYAELAELLENLPMLLRERRRAEGLSTRAAATQIGLSFTTIARFEKNIGADWGTVTAVIRWLGTTAVRYCAHCGEPITGRWISDVPKPEQAESDVPRYHLDRPGCREAGMA